MGMEVAWSVFVFWEYKDGIDNTHYLVESTQGRFVITLFETLTADELPKNFWERL